MSDGESEAGRPVELAFRDLGGRGRPIVLLHGLFGSSQNLVTVGRHLARCGHCYALDLRNHGDSPHTSSHALSDLVGDLVRWAETYGNGPIRLLGHSMGGLVAMGFALLHPGMTESLVVEDIAPKQYPLDHEREFAALRTDISGADNRQDLDDLIAEEIPDRTLRSFLLTNAVRADGGFRWRLNVEALARATLLADLPAVEGEFSGETLFLVGGKSRKVDPDDYGGILKRFPRARIRAIPEGDHWLHVSAARPFMDAVEEFFGVAGV